MTGDLGERLGGEIRVAVLPTSMIVSCGAWPPIVARNVQRLAISCDGRAEGRWCRASIQHDHRLRCLTTTGGRQVPRPAIFW
ncbi:hypothetical protein ACQP04_10480 [Pseudonocardia halophobica]|uniref:hypothetical protein n=1 Tax=Pseudonocardia halophobica TaxID=29401 RepID=UPI003D90ECE3